MRQFAQSQNKLALVGTGLLVFFLMMAVFAPLIAPFDPEARVGHPFSAPSGEHILGTNDLGQDIFSELVFGTRISLALGLLAAVIAVCVGSTIGLVAGFKGGRMEDFLMRFTDFILVLPFLPLVIIFAAYLGSGFLNLVVVIGFLTWPTTARIIRSQVIKLRSKDYILNLEAMGASTFYILKKHIVVEVLPFIVYRFMLTASYAILIEASLSFLGLGTAGGKSWGTILYYAQVRNAFLTDAWLWWIIPPGLCISLLATSFLLIGYHLENKANPKA